MLASGDDWLPLPQHLTSLASGGTPTRHDLRTGEVPFLTIECIEPLLIDTTRGKRVTSEHRSGPLRRARVREHDVLVTIKRRIGIAAVAGLDTAGSVVNQDVAVLRSNGTLKPEVLAACLNSRIGQSQARLIQTEQMNPYLSLTSLRRLKLPRLDDTTQEEIVKYAQLRVALLAEAHGAMAEASRLVRDASGIVAASGQRTSLSSASAVRKLRRLDAEFICRSPVLFDGSVTLRSLGSPAVTSRLTAGASPTAVKRGAASTPIYKVGDLTRMGLAEWRGERGSYSKSQLRGDRGSVQRGDVLVLATAHDSRYIGRAAMVHTEPPEVDSRAVAEVIIVRPARIESSASLTMFLNLPEIRTATQRIVRGQSAHLYSTDLRHLPVPQFSASLETQVNALVDRARSALSESANALAAAITCAEEAVGLAPLSIPAATLGEANE